MAELEPIVAKLRADLVDLKAGFEQAKGTVDKTTRSMAQRFENLGRRLSGFGRQATVAITLPFAAFAAGAIKVASDFEEMSSLLEVTFGDATEDVQSWAQATSKSMQRSRSDVLQFAGDFAAFLKPFGVAPNAVVPMSEALTQLTIDLSSFRNLSEQDVFGKLLSGLAGETEGLRRLGVDISAVGIEQERRRQGIKKTLNEMTQLEKVQLRFAVIMRQTSDAQGDAVRTSDSLTNRFRGLLAIGKDIARDFGMRLIPIAKLMTKALSELGQKFLALSGKTKGTLLIIGGLAAAIGPVLLTMGALVTTLGVAAGGFATLATTVVGAVSAVASAMATLVAAVATPVTAVLGLLASAAASWFLFRDTISVVVGEIARILQTVFVAGFRNNVERPILQSLNNIVNKLGLVGKVIQAIPVSLLPEKFQGIADVIQRTLSSVEVPPEIKVGLPFEFAKAFGSAQAASERDIERINKNIKNLRDSARDLIPDDLRTRFNGTLDELRQQLSALVPENLKDELIGVFSEVDIGSGHMSESLDELLSKIPDLERKFGATARRAKTAFREAGMEVRNSLAQGFEEAIVAGGRFSEVMRGIEQDITRIIARRAIVGPILNVLGIGSAKGNAFNAGKLMPFAQGGVLNSPMVFPLQNGIGLAGEAGPEAILPLRRGPSGRLGVESNGGGGGSAARVEVNVFAPPGSQVEERRTREGSTERVDLLIDQAVAGNIARPGTATHRSMRQMFGLMPATVGR